MSAALAASVKASAVVSLCLALSGVTSPNTDHGDAKTFVWNVSAVTSGSAFSVQVVSAPCDQVTVVFYLDGTEISRRTCSSPGTANFTCPPNSNGKLWEVQVICPGEDDSRGGTVT